MAETIIMGGDDTVGDDKGGEIEILDVDVTSIEEYELREMLRVSAIGPLSDAAIDLFVEMSTRRVEEIITFNQEALRLQAEAEAALTSIEKEPIPEPQKFPDLPGLDETEPELTQGSGQSEPAPEEEVEEAGEEEPELPADKPDKVEPEPEEEDKKEKPKPAKKTSIKRPEVKRTQELAATDTPMGLPTNPEGLPITTWMLADGSVLSFVDDGFELNGVRQEALKSVGSINIIMSLLTARGEFIDKQQIMSDGFTGGYRDSAAKLRYTRSFRMVREALGDNIEDNGARTNGRAYRIIATPKA